MDTKKIIEALQELKILVAEFEFGMKDYDFDQYHSDPHLLIPHFLKEISRIEIEVLKNEFSS